MLKQKSASVSQKAPKESRECWGKIYHDLPPLNFVTLHRDSYQEFLNKSIGELLSEISPVSDFTGKNWELSFGQYTFGGAKRTPAEAVEKETTYDMPLRVQTQLRNLRTGETTSQEVFLGDIPVMTEAGTFIINGIERVIINQLVRSAGVYFLGDIDAVTGRMLYFAEIRPLRGCWLEFNVSRGGVVSVRLDRRRKFPVTTFLRALGLGSNEEILKAFAGIDDGREGSLLGNTFKKDPTHGSVEGAMEIYKKMRPGEPVSPETAMDYINNLLSSPRRYQLGKVGRYKINKRLGLEVPNTPENHVILRGDIVATVCYLLRLQNGDDETYTDDIDSLANRRLRRVGELAGMVAFRGGLLRLERAIKERMSMLDPKGRVMPNQAVNARPIISAINEFFRTSQLSAILDQTNPLSEVDNMRKITVMGVGGVARDRAGFSIRDINSSQYGRICPVRSPEGPSIGLVTFLSLYAQVNEHGFILTPYRRVVKEGKIARETEEIVYLSTEDERNFKITHAQVAIDSHGYLTDKQVTVRYKGEFVEVETGEVDLIDVVPRQVVGAAAALIPFLAHDDGVRALYGANMQAQAVPLVKPEAPVVGTGMEEEIAGAMGWTIRAKRGGEVTYVDGERIVIKSQIGESDIYPIVKFKRTNPYGSCYSQQSKVKVGEQVKTKDLLIDGPATVDGELSLGANLTIAYMHFEGYGYEDAIIISERLFREDTLSSIHIAEYECEVVDTKLGPEEITRDIPNVGEADLANLDETGIVVVGAEVTPGDILIGKIAPKGETELSAEERLLRAIFGEKAREVRDTSLRVPHGERGTVISITVLDKDAGDELPPGTHKLVKVRVAQFRKIAVGDKLTGRHGNKGVISRIVPLSDMPYLADGRPVDIIISPLSVLGRMNLGQLLEAHLGWAASQSEKKVAVPVFERVPEERIIQAMAAAGLPAEGKVVVFDGRTGKPFDQKIAVGTGYFLKLHHMVEEKVHARSTGPYSLVTQQPLAGKAQMGGQRLGEMEVWALEAHRAAFTLQEMLTIKSDDVVGRAKAFEAIVKGIDIPQSSVPESFKVLVKELQSLCLAVTPTQVVTASSAASGQTTGPQTGATAADPTADEQAAKTAAEMAKELGAVISAEETPAHEAGQAGIEIEEEQRVSD